MRRICFTAFLVLATTPASAAPRQPRLSPVRSLPRHAGPAVAPSRGVSIPPARGAASGLLAAAERWGAGGPGGVPGFTRHVQPLFGKLGCTNRACHGSFQGRGGFRLSLFGSDPRLDLEGIRGGARIRPEHWRESLLLRKPTAAVAHGGGRRLDPAGWEYRLLGAWIQAGAPFVPDTEPRVRRLEIEPAELLFRARMRHAPVRIRAHFTDDGVEDVTGLTQFSANDDGVATVTARGEVARVGSGDTAMVAVYGGAVESMPVLVPYPGAEGRTVRFPVQTDVDRWVGRRLGQLGLPPSELCTDEEFLRRLSLDLVGTLPTPAEALAFAADRTRGKRERKVDELLARPAYVAWWTTRLCDQTGLNAPLFLGNTDFGPQTGAQWHAWIERRVRENIGYDRIVEGLVLGTSRRPGEGYDDYTLRMSSYLRNQDPADFTALEQMPHFWFRGNLKEPEEKALGFAYTFLGVRLDCAQCHKHPFDVWTQQDFQQFTALFARITQGIAPESQEAHTRLKERLEVAKLTTAATRRQTYWRWAAEGKPAPFYEVYVTPPPPDRPPARILGAPPQDLARVPDPRVPLMAWLRDPENPYFAPAFVNRVWAYYFGRGLVDPTDESSRGNPPTHPELLRGLARDFVAHGYDMKWLHRQITTSRTYQLSWRPNAINRRDERNLSHARLRRLPAEIAVDAILQATAGSKALERSATEVIGRRIAVQPTADEARTEFGLVVFGKPLRKANCDCEREQAPSLQQALYLRNDQDLNAALERKDGWLQEVRAADSPAALVREAYLRTLSRPPTPVELSRSSRHLTEAGSLTEGMRDLLWALLNTQEFITNH